MEGEINFGLDNEAIRILSMLKTANSFPSELNNAIIDGISKGGLSLPVFISISKWIVANRQKTASIDENGEPLYVYQFLDMLKLHEPKLKEEPVNDELRDRIKKLKILQKHKEYNKMVGNVSTKEAQTLNLKSNTKSSGISAINFIVSVIAAFGMTMYLLRYIVPDIAIRTGISVGIATALLFIEMFLAARYVDKQHDKNL